MQAGSLTTLSTPLQDFVREVDRLMARNLPLPRLFEQLVPEFQRVLAEPDLLAPHQQAPAADGYAQYPLYGCAANRFALVALVWRPGDRTPIHDHLAWGLAGVYRGRERETRYDWFDAGAGMRGLRAREVVEALPGDVIPIVPPSDVHRVENPEPYPTVSLHLYGCNVLAAPRGNSVRQIYPADLVIDDSARQSAPRR